MLATSVTHASETIDPPDWNALVDFGKRHGMIFPPQDAKLVLVHSETWSVVGNRSHPHDPANYRPGWLIEEMDDGSIRILSGMEEKTLKPREAREPLWRTFSMDEPKPTVGGYCADTGGTDGFLAAIICSARGDQIQTSIFWKHIADEAWFWNGRGELKNVPADEKAKLLLSILIWDRWELQLTEQNTDLKAIENRLQALLTEVPRLATKERKDLVHYIHLANTAPPASEESVEALLILYGKSNQLDFEGVLKKGWDTPQGRIMRRGYEAIPELLRLSKDQRITSQRWHAVMNRPSSPKLLGDIAKELLNNMIGSKPRSSMDTPREDFELTWKEISKTDELDYFEKIALKKSDSGVATHEVAFAILAEKDPERLVRIQKKFLDKTYINESASYLSAALAISKLPRESKLECIKQLASNGGIERRISAIHVLAQFDPDAAKAPARELMEILPKDAKGGYWRCAEARASHVALAIDDDDVWRIFLEKAKNAEVGLRLEWMNPSNYSYVGDRLQKRRLAFLASFLDDKTLRDETVRAEMFEGPCAGFTFPKITVRNFAAMQIASILKIEPLDPPDSTWPEDRWTVLRTEVSKRLVAEGIQL
jgi:hypothetical protein